MKTLSQPRVGVPQVLTDVLVKRITGYRTFEELLDGEGPANVNPASSREQQLADIREIYPAEKEALGTLAIEIELLPQ